jgi:hypothetical protein
MRLDLADLVLERGDPGVDADERPSRAGIRPALVVIEGIDARGRQDGPHVLGRRMGGLSCGEVAPFQRVLRYSIKARFWSGGRLVPQRCPWLPLPGRPVSYLKPARSAAGPLDTKPTLSGSYTSYPR